MVFNTLKCKDLVMLFVLRAVMFAGNTNQVRSVRKSTSKHVIKFNEFLASRN